MNVYHASLGMNVLGLSQKYFQRFLSFPFFNFYEEMQFVDRKEVFFGLPESQKFMATSSHFGSFYQLKFFLGARPPLLECENHS
jgi:hypothetical protein